MKTEDGKYVNQIPKSNLIKRAIWNICSIFLFKAFPTFVFRRWRNFVLRMFGAKIHPDAIVYGSATITNPWNLIMDKNSCIGPHAICDNDVLVTFEEGASLSQYSYICTSSHDIQNIGFDLICKPITLKKNSWVAAGSFVGMGVTIGDGAVVGARSSVFKDVEPYHVVGGNPAKFIKMRNKEQFEK